MNVRSYVLVTAGYWAFTVTDGALRMLVLLHFNRLGYSPITIAMLFLTYELMGVLTNLLGGWVGSRTGLNRTLLAGLALQIVALSALTLQQQSWAEWASVAFVMAAQALSGVAKDLTKMSSKSAVKLVAGDGKGALYRLVALLTGSKNALKGVGFFVGAALLAWFGYDTALWIMAGALVVVLGSIAFLLDTDMGRSKEKTPLAGVLSKSSAINRLSTARFFLFASRDIWFVVALPIFLDEELGWSFEGIGAFLALWVIGYGAVQSGAPKVSKLGGVGEVAAARNWSLALAVVCLPIALAVTTSTAVTVAIVGGLILFGVVFAVNSSLHSYLILAYAADDTVALDVGFYYSANAAGRLVGTLLSGALYVWGGLEAAMWGSVVFIATCFAISIGLPPVAGEAKQSATTT